MKKYNPFLLGENQNVNTNYLITSQYPEGHIMRYIDDHLLNSLMGELLLHCMLPDDSDMGITIPKESDNEMVLPDGTATIDQLLSTYYALMIHDGPTTRNTLPREFETDATLPDEVVTDITSPTKDYATKVTLADDYDEHITGITLPEEPETDVTLPSDSDMGITTPTESVTEQVSLPDGLTTDITIPGDSNMGITTPTESATEQVSLPGGLTTDITIPGDSDMGITTPEETVTEQVSLPDGLTTDITIPGDSNMGITTPTETVTEQVSLPDGLTTDITLPGESETELNSNKRPLTFSEVMLKEISDIDSDSSSGSSSESTSSSSSSSDDDDDENIVDSIENDLSDNKSLSVIDMIQRYENVYAEVTTKLSGHVMSKADLTAWVHNSYTIPVSFDSNSDSVIATQDLHVQRILNPLTMNILGIITGEISTCSDTITNTENSYRMMSMIGQDHCFLLSGEEGNALGKIEKSSVDSRVNCEVQSRYDIHLKKELLVIVLLTNVQKGKALIRNDVDVTPKKKRPRIK